jgi:NADH dehydrogenase [ubiquinone] 1 alpha subcomplex assembly factor 5
MAARGQWKGQCPLQQLFHALHLQGCCAADTTAQAPFMSMTTIFSPAARLRQRRATNLADDSDLWLTPRIADELIERARESCGSPGSILLLGNAPFARLARLAFPDGFCIHADLNAASRADVRCSEDWLPFGDQSFDLIFACGGLDSVNDLPGALILLRRALKKGGRFFGSIIGAGSLPFLREAFTAADSRAVARFHPMIDVRGAGDLLARAGFAEPVADAEEVRVRYSAVERLLKDVRNEGLGNCLAQRHPVSRATLGHVSGLFDDARDDGGKVMEVFSLIYLSGAAAAMK